MSAVEGKADIPGSAANVRKADIGQPLLANSERFQIIFQQLHRERVVSWPTPPIALDAAHQPVTSERAR